MAIRSLLNGVVLQPPPVIVEPSPLPAPPMPDWPFVQWTPAGGSTITLSRHIASGIMLGGVDDDARTVIGLDMPPQEEFDTQLPAGGELLNGRRWAARQIGLPVVIHADTLDELEEHRRELMGSFNPVRGEGVLTVAYPNGRRRSLDAAYSSGLDVAEVGRAGYPYRDSFTIILKARNPFPYGPELSVPFEPQQSYSFYAPPGDPVAVFYISSSTTTGDSTVEIDGEVEVYPVWTITGPVATATLRNRDTGRTLQLTPNLVAGQTLTVRTDPATVASQKFTRETGANVWSTAAGDWPVMWSLVPGSNRVSVLFTGTVPMQSSIVMTYRPSYLSA